MDIFQAVSLLRYAKGDAELPDYAPDFLLQPSGANLLGYGLLCVAWGQGHWLLLAMKLTRCRGNRTGRLGRLCTVVDYVKEHAVTPVSPRCQATGRKGRFA